MSALNYRNGERRKPHREYAKWRADHGLPDRCDNPDCKFHTEPLVWNGKPFKPILDHENGVNTDDRPENLRYLCPICDAQLGTKGGANKGRVDKADGGFSIRNKKTGLRAFVLPIDEPKPGKPTYSIGGSSSVTLIINKDAGNLPDDPKDSNAGNKDGEDK